jgi:hypothetical protein
MENGVAIIIGDEFENLENLIVLLPVWAPDTPKYRVIAEPIWARKCGNVLTLYKKTPGLGPEEEALSWLDVVELHHPGWTMIEFYGLSVSERIRASLEDFGVAKIDEFSGGFKAIRTKPVTDFET